MTKYIIEVGYKLLPGWVVFKEVDNYLEALSMSELISSKIENNNFKWNAFRILKVEEIFDSKEGFDKW